MEQISKEAHSEIGWAVIVWLAHTIIQIRERNLDIGTKRHIGENTVWGGMWTAEWCIIRQEALRTTTISISWKKSMARSAVSRCPSCWHLCFRLPAPELWEDWFYHFKSHCLRDFVSNLLRILCSHISFSHLAAIELVLSKGLSLVHNVEEWFSSIGSASK